MPQIRIESILGGQAPTSHFAGADQFRASLGIDPALPMDDSGSIYSSVASGLLRPTSSVQIGAPLEISSPLWIKGNTKTTFTYMLDARGSAYTIDSGLTGVTAMADGGTLTSGLGNGCEYYDNFMYFAKNTEIARYGPLTSSSIDLFDGDYWTANLGLTALINTAYPKTYKNSIQLPNHPMCRHSNGRLYFGDVVGNQGTIHYIQTTKTLVEGDTDDGSTYDAMNVGYGLWPTVIESYGSDLAIALYEGSDAAVKQKSAKVAFWDTTSTDANKIVWAEFPDNLITAMKNINGILYVVSGNTDSAGWRLSRFIGGYSFEEVYYSETGEPCLPGAIDGTVNRVLIGTHTNVPAGGGCLYSYGLEKSGLSNGMFNVMRCTGSEASSSVTAVALNNNPTTGGIRPVIGWTQHGDGSSSAFSALSVQGTTYNTVQPRWWSQTYRIGQHFKITKVRIPLAQELAANMEIEVRVYLDDGKEVWPFATVNSTDYPNGENYVVFRGAPGLGRELTGRNNFWIEIKWIGSALLTVALPIVIDYELTDE